MISFLKSNISELPAKPKTYIKNTKAQQSSKFPKQDMIKKRKWAYPTRRRTYPKRMRPNGENAETKLAGRAVHKEL